VGCLHLGDGRVGAVRHEALSRGWDRTQRCRRHPSTTRFPVAEPRRGPAVLPPASRDYEASGDRAPMDTAGSDEGEPGSRAFQPEKKKPPHLRRFRPMGAAGFEPATSRV
jgi:hypothetical protein